MNLFDDIKKFHEKFGLEYNDRPRVLPEDIGKFRIGFMAEELAEFCINDEQDQELMISNYKMRSALQNIPLDKQLDALVDLVYVVLGTAYLQGFDFNEAWRRVHEANMKKVRALREIDSKRGSIYDVVKPEGWVPPDLSDLVT